MAAPPPQRLDLCLEGLAAFQEGAAVLKAGDPLCLQQLEGGRLACATRDGAAVGLVPADKRGLLSRGPWSGTVRSVKRQPAARPAAGDAAAVGAGGEPAAATPLETDAAGQASSGGGQEEDQQQAQQQQQEEQPMAVDQPEQPAGEGQQASQQEQQQQQAGRQGERQQVVVQVLVRFTPEEQRWAQRGAQEAAAGHEEEDAARLSAEQLHMLADSEEVRWMLRDERLQKVVADIDAAPDRERALLRALQAPNFKEFADKVLATVAPEAAQ